MGNINLEELGVEISSDEIHRQLLLRCYGYAKNSTHPTTRNAALLVRDNDIILHGVNNLPIGIDNNSKRFEEKNYSTYSNYAEIDVIYKAAKTGVATYALTMVCPWAPDVNCSKGIISSGIDKLIMHKQMVERTRPERIPKLTNAINLLLEADVSVVAYTGIVGAKAYMHGKSWSA